MAKRKKRVTKKKAKWGKAQVDSDLELAFLNKWIQVFPLHRPLTQFKFSPTRQFRLDFAWVINKVGVEIHGYGPGHYSVPGMTQDFDKHMEVVKLNWKVVYLTSNHLLDKRIDDVIETIGDLMDLQKSVETAYIPLRKRR